MGRPGGSDYFCRPALHAVYACTAVLMTRRSAAGTLQYHAKGSSQSGLGGDSDGNGEYGPKKVKVVKNYKIAATVMESIDTVGRPGPRLWRVRLA